MSVSTNCASRCTPARLANKHLPISKSHFGMAFAYYLLVEIVQRVLYKNYKNRLHRLKPKGTPQGLTPSLKASRLSLALNTCGCGRCPPASNDASKKQKKVKHFSLLFTTKSKRPLFSVFCLSFVGGREPTAALAEKARAKAVGFQTRGLSAKASRRPTQDKRF